MVFYCYIDELRLNQLALSLKAMTLFRALAEFHAIFITNTLLVSCNHIGINRCIHSAYNSSEM